MKAHIEKTKSYLGDLAGLQTKTERAERSILEAAQKRLAEVQAQIERAGVGVEGASDTEQQRYIDLITERAKLNLVIARAMRNLPQ